MKSFLAILALCLCAAALVHAHGHHGEAPLDRNGVPIVHCATEEIYHKRFPLPRLADGCPLKGDCDNATTRDTTNTNKLILVRSVVHVMRNNTGGFPDGITADNVEEMMDRANVNFGAYSIKLDYDIEYHDDSKYSCIPGYSASGEWYDDVQDMKKKYAVSPSDTMNIYLACMDFSIQGTLYGVATFPWDPVVLTDLGGLFLNSVVATPQQMADGDVTLEHEAGHCFGLWHTFHGVDEVLGCNVPCAEQPHGFPSPADNLVGDFCSDTPATPLNYACGPPSGRSCDGQSWGQTDYTNFMGYGMDPTPCGNHFTDQQSSRIHCWVCDTIKPYAISGC